VQEETSVENEKMNGEIYILSVDDDYPKNTTLLDSSYEQESQTSAFLVPSSLPPIKFKKMHPWYGVLFVRGVEFNALSSPAGSRGTQKPVQESWKPGMRTYYRTPSTYERNWYIFYTYPSLWRMVERKTSKLPSGVGTS
jgi:hypothetical protein